MNRLVKNRLLSIQSGFRNNSLYSFWFLHRIITRELFFCNNVMARDRGVAVPDKSPDAIVKLYGTVMPSSVPESTSWWRHQQQDLYAMSDDSENGHG